MIISEGSVRSGSCGHWGEIGDPSHRLRSVVKPRNLWRRINPPADQPYGRSYLFLRGQSVPSDHRVSNSLLTAVVREPEAELQSALDLPHFGRIAVTARNRL